ncbi:MAG: GGDEF domain-containing protein [Bacilli bacterium]|nr:GGDEF domain-containing protein [Bacilli bacterium]
MFKEYLLENWALILILLAFVISLRTTVFLDKKTVRRFYILIATTFILSITVFVEFSIAHLSEYRTLRIVLMAIRYSAAPLILAQVARTLVKKLHWAAFVPAIVLTIIDIISIFTGIVFAVDENNALVRGFLGYLPFIVAGAYCIVLIYLLLKRSNKRLMEIIPIVFLSLTLISGVVFPFIFGSSFANIFCTTIGVALFAYYEFSIHMLTQKDSLTGLLNRQAYYADVDYDHQSINAIISLDMNGLKVINDNLGHIAGDEALVTLSICFMKALKRRQSGYRIGGDEFIIICRKNTEEEVIQLIDRINKNISETKYTCSIGYSYSSNGEKSIDEMLKESDEMMYAVKEQYYKDSKRDRRRY